MENESNIISVTPFSENKFFDKMKILGNVAKIGDAALASLFPNFKDERWERRTQIHKDEADLQKIDFDGQRANFLILWGIATGLREIKIPKEKTGSSLYFISRSTTYDCGYSFYLTR